jgi:hypothetical protein
MPISSDILSGLFNFTKESTSPMPGIELGIKGLNFRLN